eukprot:5357291-Pyramimonas_sp.AAC.1
MPPQRSPTNSPYAPQSHPNATRNHEKHRNYLQQNRLRIQTRTHRNAYSTSAAVEFEACRLDIAPGISGPLPSEGCQRGPKLPRASPNRPQDYPRYPPTRPKVSNAAPMSAQTSL